MPRRAEAFREDPPADIWPRPGNTKFGNVRGFFALATFAGFVAGIVTGTVALIIVCLIGFVAALARRRRGQPKGSRRMRQRVRRLER